MQMHTTFRRLSDRDVFRLRPLAYMMEYLKAVMVVIAASGFIYAAARMITR